MRRPSTNQRKPPAGYRAYYDALFGILWLMAVVVACVSLSWSQARLRHIDTVRTEFHLASALHLDEALAAITGFEIGHHSRELSDDARDSADSFARELRRSMYVVKQRTEVLASLHEDHHIEDFIDPFSLLLEAVDVLDSFVNNDDSVVLASRPRVAAQINVLAIRMQQLRLLHLSAHDQLHAATTSVHQRGNAYMICAAVVLLAVGAILFLRLHDAIRAQQAANIAKSEFLANMSHEIRTPMFAILGFADNLLDSTASESEKLSCIHTIQRNGTSLLGIINDILDLSKVEAGNLDAQRSATQPCAVIDEAISVVRVQAEAKGLVLETEFSGAIPETIHTNAARLRQILINLVGNAIKFTETGHVRLVTRLVSDGPEPLLQFDVVDTGLGMAPEQVARLFQPFMQADTSCTRRIGGTGLGLTISKRFAQLLGGDLVVAATTPGVGSTFRATVACGSLEGAEMLEAPQAELVEDEADIAESAACLNLLGLRVLLAEDGPDNQRLISMMLRRHGADVTVEKNGKLALDAALAARQAGVSFDIILMDMQMPVMDGYACTAQLRAGGYTGPIIALTAHAMEGDREKCINVGCTDYATKPIDRHALADLILQCVPGGRHPADSHCHAAHS